MKAQTVSVEEAARILGISRSLAYESARTKELPTIRFGKRLLVPRAVLDRLLGSTGAGAVAPKQRASK